MKKCSFIVFVFCFLLANGLQCQISAQWDSIKAVAQPEVATQFQNDYEQPYKQPLSTYGWEDGLHISRDGLHLYALYYPGDLFGFTSFFLDNINDLDDCDLLGNPNYIRPYAETFGMDMTTNPIDCDTFINVDIIYATKTAIDEPFSEWVLSDIARPAELEGGPMPLFNPNNPDEVDIFMFTGNGDIWMIRNTTANPSGIEQAIRLEPPINSVDEEFTADNPHLERLNEDTLLLVYEKYTNPDSREFLYSLSYDDGDTWNSPVTMSSINPALGKLEHPHLYYNSIGEWYMYFSIDCEIYRAKQSILNNWDSWQNIELVIAKGNTPCIGEPSLTDNGDISFSVVYINEVNNDTTDTYVIDPWFLPKADVASSDKIENLEQDITIYPNPFKETFKISSNNEINEIVIYDALGKIVYENDTIGNEIEVFMNHASTGIYVVEINTKLYKSKYKIAKE